MVDEFLKNAELFHKNHIQGNIPKANIYAKKMYKIKKYMIDNNKYESFLDYMLFSSSDMAKIWACGMSIDINYRKNEAIAILKELSNSKDDIISRDASMSLYVRCNIPI